MVKARVWIKNKEIFGLPKVEDFSLLEEELPPCKDGDIIIEALYLSVDPYMRYRLQETPVGATTISSQVARVIESKNVKFPVSCLVIGYPGWRSHSIVTAKQLESGEPLPYTRLPDLSPYSLSTALGVLGMPGNTAYFGLLEICQPKAGETVLVNGAAGAVGSAVCQIAKIKGCNVIAFAGTEKKVTWLKELGVDHVFNYKTDDIAKSIKKAAPNGVNCYFDNVGGEFSLKALPNMALFGRVALCGSISTYNQEDLRTISETPTSPYTAPLLLFKQLRVEGFLVNRWLDRWMEGINQMKTWIKEGKLQYKETVTEGFKKMPEAFIGLFHGDNIGKAIVKV